jgi:hypothetical protein
VFRDPKIVLAFVALWALMLVAWARSSGKVDGILLRVITH